MTWGITTFLIGYVQLKSLDLFICWVYDKIFKEPAFPYNKISD